MQPQDRYLVRLDNFIPRLPVRLLLLLSSNNNSSGTIDDASSSVFQLDLGAITVDVTGSAAVVRRLFEEVMDVPDPLLPKEKGATFRVRAQQEVGEGEGVVTDFSRPFALSRTWRDRRLDGSSEAVVARRNRRHRRRRRR